jgi:hypothetical protein
MWLQTRMTRGARLGRRVPLLTGFDAALIGGNRLASGVR